MEKCSLLVGLRLSSQSLDKLAQTFRELCRISGGLRETIMLTSSAKSRLSAAQWSGKSLIYMTNNVGPIAEHLGTPPMASRKQ